MRRIDSQRGLFSATPPCEGALVLAFRDRRTNAPSQGGATEDIPSK